LNLNTVFVWISDKDFSLVVASGLPAFVKINGKNQ